MKSVSSKIYYYEFSWIGKSFITLQILWVLMLIMSWKIVNKFLKFPQSEFPQNVFCI